MANRRRWRPPPATPTRLAFLVLGVLSIACQRWDEKADLAELRTRVSPSGFKVLIVGIDGATFQVIDPLIARGELPTTARLIREGTRADLRSVKPMKSPALWTSMVTGRLRTDHGIEDFTTTDAPVAGSNPTTSTSPRLVTARDRRTLALWNITSAFGLTNGIVGWWVSWPAEELRGYMVSDRVVRSRWGEWTGEQAVEARTYPDSLAAEIAPLIIDPDHPPVEEFASLIDWTPPEQQEFLDVRHPIFAHGPSVFKFAHCAQRSYEEIALHLLRTAPEPDLTAIFLIALDPVCHTFWHYYQPERFIGVDAADARRLGNVVPGYYRHNDAYLGELLELVDSRTVVLIVSDHGFQASGQLPRTRSRAEFAALRRAAAATDQVAVGQSGKHQQDGVFIAWGGPVRAGATITASIHDVTPTVLALLGLPVARDMAGRVLTELVDPGIWNEHPIRYVDSYEGTIRRPSLDRIAHVPDPRLREQLRALGYVDGETGDDVEAEPR